MTCGPASSCVQGACVTEPVDSGTSPDAGGTDAGPLDAGHDAGSLDAGRDAGPLDAGRDAGPLRDGGFFRGDYCLDGWCSEFPYPGPYSFDTIHLADDRSGYLSSDEGLVARWDGTSWSPLIEGGSATFVRSIDVLDATHLYIGGSGRLTVFDGVTFTNHDHPGNGDWMNKVWAASATDVWVVYSSVGVYRWNGATFTAANVGVQSYSISALWGTGSNDVWLVGPSSTVRHFTGTQATTVPLPGGAAAGFSAVVGRSATDVLLGGTKTFWWNGTTLADVSPPGGANVLALAATPSRYWAVGDQGFLASYQPGQGWTRYPTNTTLALTGVTATATQVWAVGLQGLVYRWNGSGFDQISGPPPDTLINFELSHDHRGGMAWTATGSPWQRASDGTWYPLDGGLTPPLHDACMSGERAGAAVSQNRHVWRIDASGWRDLGGLDAGKGQADQVVCLPGGDVYLSDEHVYGSPYQLWRQQGTSAPRPTGLSTLLIVPTHEDALWSFTPRGPGSAFWDFHLVRDGGSVTVCPMNLSSDLPYAGVVEPGLQLWAAGHYTYFGCSADGGATFLRPSGYAMSTFGTPAPVADGFVGTDMNQGPIEWWHFDGGTTSFAGISSGPNVVHCAPGVCRMLYRGGVWRRDF